MWPIFGIANQLLAAVALSVATSVLMRLKRFRYALLTLLPLAVLVAITFSAAYQKVLNPAPSIGFLAHAHALVAQATNASPERLSVMRKLIFADRLNAVITTFFVALVAILMLDSLRLWIALLLNGARATSHETPFVPTRLAEGEI